MQVEAQRQEDFELRVSPGVMVKPLDLGLPP